LHIASYLFYMTNDTRRWMDGMIYQSGTIPEQHDTPCMHHIYIHYAY
jgi:hypothetical protein